MSNFTNLKLLQGSPSVSALMPIPYSGIPGGQLLTDPAFYYDPTTQTIHVLNITFTDLLIDGDITFSKETDHIVSVANSTSAGVDGGDLSVLGANGAIASGVANGGDGGSISSLSGDGGAGLAAQQGGPGGDN